jgi:hypothetical protein
MAQPKSVRYNGVIWHSGGKCVSDDEELNFDINGNAIIPHQFKESTIGSLNFYAGVFAISVCCGSDNYDMYLNISIPELEDQVLAIKEWDGFIYDYDYRTKEITKTEVDPNDVWDTTIERYFNMKYRNNVGIEAYMEGVKIKNLKHDKHYIISCNDDDLYLINHVNQDFIDGFEWASKRMSKEKTFTFELKGVTKSPLKPQGERSSP